MTGPGLLRARLEALLREHPPGAVPVVPLAELQAILDATAPRRCTALRHWYAYRGQVGSSSPTCVRCGSPNPKYRPADDPRRNR